MIDSMNFRFLTCHDTQSTHEMLYSLRAQIASGKCLDISIELRLTVTDNFVWILEANQPEKRRDTDE